MGGKGGVEYDLWFYHQANPTLPSTSSLEQPPGAAQPQAHIVDILAGESDLLGEAHWRETGPHEPEQH